MSKMLSRAFLRSKLELVGLRLGLAGEPQGFGLRFGLDAGLLADPMRQHAEHRRHFGKRLACARRRHSMGEPIDTLHNAVIEHQQAIFERLKFQTSRVFDEVREDEIVPFQGRLKRIKCKPRFQALPHLGKTEAAIEHRCG